MAENKQFDDRGKRKKRPYFQGQGKRRAEARELCPGVRGILITCNSQERQCLSEAYNLLNEYAARLYGPEKLPSADGDHGDSDADADDDGDIEAAIKKEVAALKSTKPGERRFQSIRSGAKNVIFIRCTKEIDVCKLVHHMLSDILETKKAKARFSQRFLPAGDVAHIATASIKEQAKRVLAPYFHKPACQTEISFAVVYKCRNNTDMSRDDVIKMVADVAVEGGIAHKVDLSSPRLVICVEIIKTMCCMSVLEDFYKLKRYNIHSILVDGRAAEKVEGAADNAAEGADPAPAADKAADADASKKSTEAEEKPS